MDSEWRLNVVRAGQEDEYFNLGPTPVRAYLRWAVLLTPLVIAGITYLSIVQVFNVFGLQSYLSRSGPTTYDAAPLDRFWANGPGFPHGLAVHPDH